MINRDQFYIELGSRLRTKRESVGLTQADVAETAGISRTSLTNIEGGRQRILVDQLALICSKLGVTAAELIPVGIPTSNNSQANLAQIPIVANFVRSVTGGQGR